jgi:acetyl-CoA carboxylase biotin carboxyl carrier protein
MDWPSYKRICDRPDVFSRWMLMQTRELLIDGALVARLEQFMSQVPIEKPLDHRGNAETDMLVVSLELEELDAIRAAVAHAVSSGRRTEATRSRGLGGFVEAWDEYRRMLLRSPRAGSEVITEERRMSQVRIEAIVTGRVWKLETTAGTRVNAGDALLILESMKMEIPIESPVSGRVVEILVAVEEPVEEGQVVAVVEA